MTILTSFAIGAGLGLFAVSVAVGTYGWLEMLFGDDDE
jgi:hypothetical protein